MRKTIGKILIIIATLIFLYPFISKVSLKDSNQSKTIDTFAMIKEATEEEKRLLNEEKEDYNKELLNGAFNSEGNAVNLNLPSVYLEGKERKAIGILYIPRLDEYMPVYIGADDEILSVGVGIIKNTSIPGGKGTHSVISGHRGTHNADIFRHLDEVEKGDEFFIFLNNETLKYKVNNINIVSPEDAGTLRINPNDDKVTLLTCTPYLINTERLLVTGDRIQVDKEDKKVFEEQFKEKEDKQASPTKIIRNVMKTGNDTVFSIGRKTTILIMSIVFLILVFILFIIPLFFRKSKKRKKKKRRK